MCGVPVDKAEDYLERLIAAGHRVAVCEQTEDPAEARKRGSKSVVRRAVVRLVTPGTITEDRLLEPGRPNWLAAVARRKLSDGEFVYAVAATDISTGRFIVSEAPATALMAEIARLEPREIIVPDAIHDDDGLRAFWDEHRSAITPVAHEVRSGIQRAAAEGIFRRGGAGGFRPVQPVGAGGLCGHHRLCRAHAAGFATAAVAAGAGRRGLRAGYRCGDARQSRTHAHPVRRAGG